MSLSSIGTRNQSFLAVMFYNTVFTAFGPFYYAVFDRDVNDMNCIRFPQLHRQGILHNLFNMKRFTLMGLKAVCEAAVITFLSMLACEYIDFGLSSIEMYAFGMLTITSGILVANMTCALYQATSTWISIVGFWLVFLVWILGVGAMSVFPTLFPYYYGDFALLMSNPNTYFVTLLMISISSLVTLAYIAVRNECWPSLSNFIQDVQIRKADPTVLLESLEEWEKTKDLHIELKTLKALPEDTTMPELMRIDEDGIIVSEEHLRTVEDVAEEEETVGDIPTMTRPSYKPTTLSNVHRSIQSIAGLRALSICEQLHGPSYDPQSVNYETQHELIKRINSHRWRFGKETGLMGVLKTTLKESVNTINQLVPKTDGRKSVDYKDSPLS